MRKRFVLSTGFAAGLLSATGMALARDPQWAPGEPHVGVALSATGWGFNESGSPLTYRTSAGGACGVAVGQVERAKVIRVERLGTCAFPSGGTKEQYRVIYRR